MSTVRRLAMTDDIVTRLRLACRSNGPEYCDNCQPCDAANEIERLRAERTYYEEMALHIAGRNFDANEEIHRLKIHLKAVRGE